MGKYRFLGKDIPRKDAREIVTGGACFLGDIRLPDMLWAKALRSPHPHAVIRSIDTGPAQRLKGVKAVLTWRDVPAWKGGTPRHSPVLDQKVRFVGDVAALVAAVSEEVAAAALELITPEYDILPAVFDVEEALSAGAPRLYEEFPGNILPLGSPFFGPLCLKGLSMGDMEEGFREADAIAEGTFRYENIPNPLPAEAPGAIASWEEPNRLTLWISAQTPYMDKITLFHVLGKEVEVRTHGGHCGGSFGSKMMSWRIQCQAALLSRATRKPVKFLFTKEEHLAAFTVRPGSRMQARVGMKKDGAVTAISGRWLVDTGCYSMTTQAQVAVACGEAQLMVRCTNWDLKPTVVLTNRNASGIVRGFGGQELKCALIPALCLAMEKMDLDPLEFFKKNYVKPGDGYFWRDGKWYVYRGVDYREAMNRGAAQFGWKEKWKGWLKPSAVEGNLRRGVGVAVHGNADIGEDASEAYVRLHPDGTALLFSCLSEHGTGQRTNLAKMVAEVLQLPLERVSVTPADSLINPYEIGPLGSRGTYAIGSAVIAAAREARQNLFQLAAPALQTAVEDLDTRDGMVYVKTNPEKKVPWRVMGVDRTCLGRGRFDPDFTLANCMMTFVEVEVDTETGKAILLEAVNATDVGQVIDPAGLQGQLNGCLSAGGTDSALCEETIIDRKSGHMVNANMIDYKWRTFADLPALGNVILETPFASHCFHAIGVGEVATAPGPAAVLMAVSNAIGVWLHDYPSTPERILKALEKKKKNQPGRGGS